MTKHSKPNLRIPMVHSINAEMIDGDVFNEQYGQHNVNMIHEETVNAAGDKTMYLCRRPGWDVAQSSYGTTTKIVYGLFRRPSDAGATWAMCKDTNDQVITDGTTSTVLFTDANYLPGFVTICNLAGTAKAVLQFRKDFSTAHRVFYGSAIGSWTEITDAVFAALVHRGKIEFIDGHLLVMASDRNIYNSKLNDPATWPAGNLVPKSIRLDIPSGLILHKNIVLAFGTESVEGFVTDGTNNPSGTILSRRKDLTANIGLSQTSGNGNVSISSGLGNYYAEIGGYTFFLGRERGGRESNALYAFDGANFQKISGDIISRIFSSSGYVYGIHPFAFYGRRCIALSTIHPGGANANWWLFDIDSKQWYYWESSLFGPINDGETFAGMQGYRDKLFLPGTEFGDGTSGASAFSAYAQFEIPNPENTLKRMAWYGVQGDTSPSANNVTVLTAKDDAITFATRGTIKMASQQKRAYRGGAFRKRVVKLLHSTNAPWRITEFQARIVE